MWFIELPEGTSLWEYTSVRMHLEYTSGHISFPSESHSGCNYTAVDLLGLGLGLG